jgi:translocation and assembly module TamA
LLEASLEVRGRVWGPWGAAAFVDAGSISRSGLPSLNDVRLGAGVGLRYDAGFAPFRIDVGFPLSRRQGDELLQVYISIGQAF